MTFALHGASHADHVARATAIGVDGYAALTTTLLHERSVLRLCTINPLTTEADLAGTIERI